MGLTKKQMEAAKLIAEGYLTQREIAEKVDVREETISRWKKQMVNLTTLLQVLGIFYMDTKPTEFVSLYKLTSSLCLGIK